MGSAARAGAVLLLAAALATALVAAGGSPAGALGDLRAAGSATDPMTPLLAAATLLGQVLAGYLVVVAALALSAELPGLLGRAARRCADRVTPQLLRRSL